MSRLPLFLFISLLFILLGGCGSSKVSDTPVSETQPSDSASSEDPADPEPLPPESSDPTPTDPEPLPPESSDPPPAEPEPVPPESSEPPPSGGSACQPSASEQLMLDLVNDARSQSRQCGSESHAATQALQWDCKLASAADTHSRDMVDNNFFSHTGSNGLRVTDRVTAAGYEWRAVGENIAAGQPTEESVMLDWLGSPGHCTNIMNANYKDFGSAVIFTDQASFSSYWTQVFGAQR